MENKRTQFEFSPEAMAEIDQLQSATGFATRAELFRHALRFFQWAVEQTVKNGATLLLEKDGKLREVVFPYWAPVGRSGSEVEKRETDREEVKAKAAFAG